LFESGELGRRIKKLKAGGEKGANITLKIVHIRTYKKKSSITYQWVTRKLLQQKIVLRKRDHGAN